jgi:signal transduction histidine kinase
MIPMTIDDEEPGLCAIAAGRHARLQPRIAAYLACAVLLAPLAGWGVASVWAAGLVALAAGEAVSHRNKTHRPMGVSLAFLAGEGLVGGALGVGAVVNGGALGAACGVMFLTLALFSTGAARRGSAAAFVAGAGPLAAYLVLSAALAGRASERPIVTLALVLMAIAVCAVVAFVWKTCAEALAGELRARAEAERRLLEAEAAGRATAEFVALARSALTRPLQAVRGGADSLRRTAPALRAQAERFEAAGVRAQAMLDDLRDLADLDAGRLTIERSTFDLRAFMSDLSESWSPRAKARGLALELEGVENLPEAVLGDRERLRQMLDGLISHALEVTDVGVVAVSAHAVRLADDERRAEDDAWLVRFGVSDNGPGLRAGEAVRLFTPFERQGEATGRTGAALGLSVGRGIARLMGGDLYAASSGGRGAAFTLEATFAAPQTVGASRSATVQSLAGAHVLIADRQENDRRAAALILEPFGVRLTEASSPEAALELLGAHTFDLVLVDMDSEGGFSREACRRLRAAAGPNRRTPMVGCSAEAVDIGQVRGWGLSGVAAKPFDAAVLGGVVAQALAPPSPRSTAAA